jgi:hypothetical protein
MMRYIAHVRKKGTIEVLNMSFMLLYKFVPVTSETNSALVETGEHLSPQNTPDKIAPPISTGFMLKASPIVIQMDPIVAAVPKAVPVRKESPQLSRNAITGKYWGTIRLLEYATIAGIVPLCLHKAVRTPISIKVMSTFLAVITPPTDILHNSLTENPFNKEYPANRTYPRMRAYSTEMPVTTQQSNMATNKSSTIRSAPFFIASHPQKFSIFSV